MSSSTLSKSEANLSNHIKKATNTDETAPKRKHVRACIVYSWDHRSARAFWNALKLQPLHNDEIQLFKALITIHKVLQEGHPSVIREAQGQVSWITSLGRQPAGVNGGHGYGKLIHEYVELLLRKLEFHRLHQDFNGTFEYEEYISLRLINDPNEGYEVIIDLLGLQDSIDDFQRLVFASISHGRANECKISSLTPMVAESYGIYRFLTSMLRALHQTTNDDGALEPLRQRYYSQHNRLLNFYYDCSSLKYLTSLIHIPQLTEEPPNLFGESDDAGPALPKRPISITEPSIDSSAASAQLPEPTGDWWAGSDANAAYEEQQRRLEAERQEELVRQQQQAMLQQQQFEEQQRVQLEQQRMAQEALLQQQQQQHTQGQLAEIERDLLNVRGQYEQSQLMLDQYDRRVKALEYELEQVNNNNQMQIQSKNDLIQSLQEQVNMWKSKYESLAKLYSQLRQEHLEMIAKFKQVKGKAASAQEAIDKRDRLERDLKSKNLELADLIKERDRARYEIDKAKGNHQQEIEKLERELRMTNEKLMDSERGKGSDLSLLISKHNRELSDLEEALKSKQRLLEDYQNQRAFGNEGLKEKEEENEILQETINTMELALKEMSMNGNSSQLINIIDSILKVSAEQIQSALFDFESPMQAGNQNSTANYLLTIIEKTSTTSTEFSTAFNNFTAETNDLNGDSNNEEISAGNNENLIKTIIEFSNCIGEVLVNSKGLSRISPNDEILDLILDNARECAISSSAFLTSLTSDMTENLNQEDIIELVISQNVEVQENLQSLSLIAEKLKPKSGNLMNGNQDLDVIVDNEMTKVSNAIENANERLKQLISQIKTKFSTFDVQVNEAILMAASTITTAIGQLIKAATDCQEEIIQQGRGTSSAKAYLKKHNRWTEGLISAARSVGGSTTILIETADGVLGGQHSPEELIVACNEVTASTAQLVAASRVKTSFMSKTQDKLELASKSVTKACRSLVDQVGEIMSSRTKQNKVEIDWSKLSHHEYRTKAMEQQVEVLRLEQALTTARNELFEIRKFDYIDDDDDNDNENITGVYMR